MSIVAPTFTTKVASTVLDLLKAKVRDLKNLEMGTDQSIAELRECPAMRIPAARPAIEAEITSMKKANGERMSLRWEIESAIEELETRLQSTSV